MDDRDRMDRRAPWIPWAITSLALVLVAVIAYSLGAQREGVAVAEAPVRRVFYGFPGFWLFFVLFWMFGGLRRMWWGCYPYRRWRYGRYAYHPYDDERDDWEEWHRRAHNRTDAPGSGGTSTASGTDRGPIT